MATKKEATVATPGLAFRRMEKLWHLPAALLGGTLAMRGEGKTYLPQFERETTGAYNQRRDSSTLYNAFGHTVDILEGMPFNKPIVLGEGTWPRFEEWAEDMDLSGTDVTAFGRSLLQDGLVYGKFHVLVEFPFTEQEDGKILTLRDEQEMNIRPYCVRISPDALIGWRGERIGGIEMLDRVRFMQVSVEEGDNEWDESEVTRIRVIYPDHFEVWTQVKKDEWKKESDAPNTLGKVALVTGYMKRVGLLESKPPLEDLAWLNSKHWQSQSDQDNIEHVVRVPILFLSGFSDEQVKSVTIGPHAAINHANSQADMKYVTHGGDGASIGRTSLHELKEEMDGFGTNLIVAKPGNETATAKSIDKAESISDLQAGVIEVESALESVFQLMGEWVQEKDMPVEVTINQDFGLSLRESVDLQELREARKLGDIDQRTYLTELQRRGILSDKEDIDSIISLTEEEGGNIDDAILEGIGRRGDEDDDEIDDEELEQAA